MTRDRVNACAEAPGLPELRRQGLADLARVQGKRLLAGERSLELGWRYLLADAFAEGALPAELRPHLDERASLLALGASEARLTFLVPGCWPIECRFERSAGRWALAPADEHALDHESRPAYYAVVADPGTEWEWVLPAHSLGAALVMAQRHGGGAS